jgi:tetratricopeptide (TPR) repeat protein
MIAHPKRVSHRPPDRARRALWQWGPAVLLACASLWVYGRAANGPFIFDDYNSVQSNVSIRRLWPLWGSSELPGPLNPPKNYCTAGRPLVNLSLAVNYHFGGLSPAGYRTFNIVVHWLSAMLLAGITRRTLLLDFFAGRFDSVALLLALCVALLWAVHPLNSEAVVYVTQRTELMVAFFYLGTLYASVRYFTVEDPRRRAWWLIVAVLACFAGMACKEAMVSAPLVVLLYERTFVRGSFRRALAESWPLYVGLAASWGLLAALNYSGPRSATAGFNLGVPAQAWWFTQAQMFWGYLKLAIWPWPLSIRHELPYLFTFHEAWMWLLSTALIAGLALVLLVRGSASGFPLACMFAILAPTMIVPIVTEVGAERRMYLPLAALVALAVLGTDEVLRRLLSPVEQGGGDRTLLMRRPSMVTGAIALLLAVTLASLTERRLDVYRDNLALWQDSVDNNPADATAQNNLGHALIEAGEPLAALPHLEAAVRLKPDYAHAQMNIGVALMRLGKLRESIPYFQQAIVCDPEEANAHYVLGIVLFQSGDLAGAARESEEAVRLNPHDSESHNNLGFVLHTSGRSREAIPHILRAIELQPDNLRAHTNLALAYAGAGQPEEAAAAANAALALAPLQDRAALAAELQRVLGQGPQPATKP